MINFSGFDIDLKVKNLLILKFLKDENNRNFKDFARC